MNNLRKVTSILLAALVIFFTGVAILAIWDFIEVKRVFQKSISTLFVLFVSAAILLFIFSVVLRGEGKEK